MNLITGTLSDQIRSSRHRVVRIMVWPVDYPFEVTRAVPVLPRPAALKVPLAIGAIGRINQQDRYGNVEVQLPIDDKGLPGATGWIPQNCVKIGSERTITQGFDVEIQAPPVPSLSTSIYFDEASLFTATVSGLLSSYHIHREDYPIQPEYLDTELNTDIKVRILESSIISGVGKVSGRLRDLFASGNFTVQEARDASPVVTANTFNHHTGIYWILVDIGDGLQPNRFKLYAGSTEDSFQNRYRAYLKEIGSSSNRQVIRAICNAARWWMFPICYLEGLGNGSPVIKLAEQVFLDLGQTYSTSPLSFQRATDFEDGDDTTTTDNELSAVAKSIIRKEQCSIMSRIATAVFRRTGWPGCVRRTREGTSKVSAAVIKPFGCNAGLNAQCPITEMTYAKVPFVKTKGPGFSNFRRTNVHLSVRTSGSGAENMSAFFGHCHDGRGVRQTWHALVKESYPYPPKGTYVHAVFEVLESDKLSTAPLSQLPAIGPFSDWQDASRIALRIEWMSPEGVWEGTYFQMGGPDERVANAPEFGGTQQYNVPIGLRNFLLQQRRQLPPNFSWLWDFGTARVKEVYLDHLRQRICVRDVNNVRTVPGPTVKTADAVGRELTSNPVNLSRVARPGDATWPLYPSGRAKDRQQRRSCDGCYVITLQPDPQDPSKKMKYGRNTECKRHGTLSCVRCFKLGRICTFSASADFDGLSDYHYKKRALIAPYRKHGVFKGRVGEDMTRY